MNVAPTLCIVACFFGQGLLACSWIPVPFCGTSNARPDDVVLSGKIVNVDLDGIDLEVIDVLSGSESRDTIRIWDGTDWDCNGLFSMAAADLGGLNDSIIVILPLIVSIENPWDALGDYRRPDYYEYTPNLSITDGMVVGYIAGSACAPIWGMPYLELVTNWSDPDNCSTILSVDGTHHAAPFVAHLANNTLNLTIRSDLAAASMIRIHATNGQEVVVVKSVPGTMQIDLSGYSEGVYHVVLVQHDGFRSSVRMLKL
jgi:hypothetical protein